MTSEAHSSGSDFIGDPGKCAIKIDVFGVVTNKFLSLRLLDYQDVIKSQLVTFLFSCAS